MLIGIDEAGRGPVLGPLVVCGVAADPATSEALGALDLRDSKSYGSGGAARQRRRQLAAKVRQTARVALRVAAPALVDTWVARGGLNELERQLAAEIIAELAARPTRIVADGARLFGPLSARYPMLEAIDKAEGKEHIVAAASVVAKDARDEEMEAITARYSDDFGPISGGGYPNAATERFLRAYVARHRRLPEEVRLSWGWRVLDQLDPDRSVR